MHVIAFGVVLWELTTRGSILYPGLDNKQIYDHLESGNRLECPNGIPDHVADLMKHCWEWEPKNRPTFHEVHSVLNSKSEINEGESYCYPWSISVLKFAEYVIEARISLQT